MKIQQYSWFPDSGWDPDITAHSSFTPQLVLVFGGREQLIAGDVKESLTHKFPGAYILYSSTAGEIQENFVRDNSLAVTAIQFEKTTIRTATSDFESAGGRFEAGVEIANQLLAPDLKLVFVLSDGQNVNGSELVNGLNFALPGEVPVTGGLAGDGTAFSSTIVGLGTELAEGKVVAIGLYGESLKVGFGSQGGWDPFGPDRVVTESDKNVLFQLDGKSALELYKLYLGEYAAELPGSGLRFPLLVKGENGQQSVVRTILNVDEQSQSLIFAGDILEGKTVRLMRANYDKLVDGAHNAAMTALEILGAREPELAILVSCVGRKIILGQRIEEEVEEVREVVGNGAFVTGFYSYGEICPTNHLQSCSLHNQSMTITMLAEV